MSEILKENSICFVCIGEQFLSKEVEFEGCIGHCSYCDSEENEVYDLLKFAERIDKAFEQHYVRMGENPPDDWSIEQIKEMAGEWEPEGVPIIYAIMDAANISEEIARDVQKILESTHYSRSNAEIGETSDYYRELNYDFKGPDDVEWQTKWVKFEQIIKTKNRYFNSEAAVILRKVFDDIDSLSLSFERPVVRVIGIGTDITFLYRGRVFQSDEKLKLALESPDLELGPTPWRSAKGGRMNASGISVFYGATNPEAVLAEIRPPVGSKALIGKFEILRPLRMLDISAFNSSFFEGSIFDTMYAELLSRSIFLRNLSQRMTRAIMPDDELFDYLPTQVIADFLGSELKFDGIIFPSAQSKKGLNIALFNHASRVKEIKYPENSRIEVRLTDWEDDFEIESYSVNIFKPKKLDSEKYDGSHIWNFSEHEGFLENPNFREMSLKLDVKSIIVKHILSVKINSNSFSVHHSEVEKYSFSLNMGSIEDK